jgi:hypothetical protein
MRNLLVALAVLLAPAGALAYSSPTGNDPANSPTKEYKPIAKSAVAGVSDAISAGDLLLYSVANDGYTVTRVGSGANDVNSSRLIAGVSKDAIATGDVGYHLVQTRGYATVKYDASSVPINRGQSLCANSVGAAVLCTVVSSADKVIALEAKTSGTGTDLKVLLSAD